MQSRSARLMQVVVAAVSLALLAPATPTTAAPRLVPPLGAPSASAAARAFPTTVLPAKKEAKTKAKAAAAFKRWVKYWNVQDWEGQYARLVDEQKALFTEEEYSDYRDDTDAGGGTAWVKTVRTKKTRTDIPGTDVVMPAIKVTARVKIYGHKTTVSMHCYYQGGRWRWAITEEALDEIVAYRDDSPETDEDD